jgi:hypothetical protein
MSPVRHPDLPSSSIARGQLAEFDRIVSLQAADDDRALCDDYLQLGIQVFQWILKADQDYRRGLYQNPALHNEATEAELESLLRGWLARGRLLLARADAISDAGRPAAHLAEFRQCCNEATAIVESWDESEDDPPMPEALILLRDQALIDHQNGETSEFV